MPLLVKCTNAGDSHHSTEHTPLHGRHSTAGAEQPHVECSPPRCTTFALQNDTTRHACQVLARAPPNGMHSTLQHPQHRMPLHSTHTSVLYHCTSVHTPPHCKRSRRRNTRHCPTHTPPQGTNASCPPPCSTHATALHAHHRTPRTPQHHTPPHSSHA